jgi:hypothetical protein
VSAVARGRRLDDLSLQLKGLVHVRALLESNGASPAAVNVHSEAIDRVRAELTKLARPDGLARGNA